MTIATWVKSKIKNHLVNLINTEVQKQMEYLLPQLLEFQKSPVEERQSYNDHTKDPIGNISFYVHLKDRLLATGVPVEEVDIDVNDFEKYLDSFPEINNFYKSLNDAHIEKCLEHYLAYRYLNITKDDLYIDIASAGSPWANILNRRGIKSYRLDLCYPEGLHGKNIGADAGNTKLPDAFANVLSAQCAYECFMGDADVRFVTESARILKEKGRFGIVPLYLEDTHFVATSPYCDQKKVIIESEAKKVWRDDKFNVPFSRHYSPESFNSRVYLSIPPSMTGKVFYFRNLPDIMKHFEGQRIYCFFMFFCEKRLPNNTKLDS